MTEKNESAPERMNESAPRTESGAELTQPRSLSDLRAFLHGYRIKARRNMSKSARASIIIGCIDEMAKRPPPPHQLYLIVNDMRRAAKTMATMDPSLTWLPSWKPRVLAKGAE